MTDRLALRPIIKTRELEQSSPEEQFQTLTLRPILKLQNELLLGLFKNYIVDSKSSYYTFSKEEQALFIVNSVQQNIVLKNKLIGVIIGMFTVDGLAVYSTGSNSYNKRIVSLIIERISSQASSL